MCARICVAAIAALALLASERARAAAMRCSGEQTICIAVCKKGATNAALPLCLTNCGQRNSICMKTGCWDNGTQKYCGLLRQ